MSKALGTNTFPPGIIKFGSTDEAVLFQDALASKPALGTELGTGISYSSAGMDTNGTGALQIDMSTIDYTSLTNSGQISFDIISTAISTPADSDFNGSTPYNHYGSNGKAPDTLNDYLLSWADSATGGKAGRLYVSTDNIFRYQMEWGDTLAENGQRLTNHGRETEYETVTLSWQGDALTIYISGSPLGKVLNGILLPANLFKYISVGTYQAQTSASYVTSAGKLIKNLIVSNRPVMFAGHPMLRKIVFMGDSFGVAAAARTLGSPSRFNYQSCRIAGGYLGSRGLNLSAPNSELPKTGLTAVNYTSTSVNGTVVDDTGTIAAPISDTEAATLAEKPSIIALYAGINDVRKTAGYDIAVFEAAYKSLLTNLLSGTGIEKVFIHTIISHIGEAAEYTATAISRTAEINAVINSLPAWWATTKAATDGDAVLIDLFTAFGGEPANDSTIYGRWNVNVPVYDAEIHPSSYGGWIMGNELGKAIYKQLM